MTANFSPTTFVTITKNRFQQVRLTLGKYRGKVQFDLRIYCPDYGGEFQPTKKGVSLSLEHYATLTKGMRQLGDFLADEGLLPVDPEAAPDNEAPKSKPRRNTVNV